MAPTHFNGPLSGSPTAWAGGGADLPIDAISGDDWFVYANDFFLTNDYDATNDFTLTAITGGTAALEASNIGLLRLDAPAQNQGPIVQLDGPAGNATPGVLPTAGSTTAEPSVAILAARFALLDADTTDAFVGLAELNATSAVLTAAGALTSDTHAGFHVTNALNGVFQISVAGDDDTAAVTQASAFTATDTAFVDVAVRIEGTTSASFYWRPAGKVPNSRPFRPHPWASIGTLTAAAAWDARMYPTIALVGDAASDYLDLDRIVFAVKRDLTI